MFVRDFLLFCLVLKKETKATQTEAPPPRSPCSGHWPPSRPVDSEPGLTGTSHVFGGPNTVWTPNSPAASRRGGGGRHLAIGHEVFPGGRGRKTSSVRSAGSRRSRSGQQINQGLEGHGVSSMKGPSLSRVPQFLAWVGDALPRPGFQKEDDQDVNWSQALNQIDK